MHLRLTSSPRHVHHLGHLAHARPHACVRGEQPGHVHLSLAAAACDAPPPRRHLGQQLWLLPLLCSTCQMPLTPASGPQVDVDIAAQVAGWLAALAAPAPPLHLGSTCEWICCFRHWCIKKAITSNCCSTRCSLRAYELTTGTHKTSHLQPAAPWHPKQAENGKFTTGSFCRACLWCHGADHRLGLFDFLFSLRHLLVRDLRHA